MCHTDPCNHFGIAEDKWRAGEAVEESNAGAEKNRGDVDVDFIKESSVEALLNDIGAVDTNGLPGRRRCGLFDSGLNPIGDKVHG